jgi:predicted metal-dependent phosphoesterase TrpH
MQSSDLDRPSYAFSGQLTVADFKRHIPLPFSVPPGTTCLEIDFRFEPWKVADIKNKVTVSLYEPGGAFRGTSNGGASEKAIRVSLGHADEGFFPGRLPPGEWRAELDTCLIMPGPPISYEMRIQLSEEPEAETQARLRLPQRILRRSAGWYRGDLHLHTYHSDGHMSVAELLDMARQHDLDFVALTDHNNVTQLYHKDLEGVDDLVVIPGIELSTFYGHALSLGTTRWIDWRIGRNGRTMQDAADEVHAQGGILTAAHPGNAGDPTCTGCRWLFSRFQPGGLDGIEVWNGPWHKPRATNEISLQIWYHWLSAGHRLPATAGSDGHRTTSYLRPGSGFNLIWADELSAKALLRGLRQGHVMLSSGPRLWIEASGPGGDVAMMGDVIPATGPAVPVRMSWLDAPTGAAARLVADGYLQAEWTVAPAGERSVQALAVRSVSAELRDAQGTLLALTNPIYLDSDLHL